MINPPRVNHASSSIIKMSAELPIHGNQQVYERLSPATRDLVDLLVDAALRRTQSRPDQLSERDCHEDT
jgi:hypothetical protein